jgi:hypothetical protein
VIPNAIFIGIMSALIVGSGVLMLSVIGGMIKNAAERGESNSKNNEYLNLKDYETYGDLLVSFLKGIGLIVLAGLLVYVIAAYVIKDFVNVYESLSAAIFVIVILTIPLCIGTSNAYSRLKLQKMLQDRKKPRK